MRRLPAVTPEPALHAPAPLRSVEENTHCYNRNTAIIEKLSLRLRSNCNRDLLQSHLSNHSYNGATEHT